MVASDFAVRRLGKVLQGIVVLVVRARRASTSTGRSGGCSLIPLAIVAARSSTPRVWIALATIAFWIVDAIEVVNAFTYGGNFLAQYPLGIFGALAAGLVVVRRPARVRLPTSRRSTSSTRTTRSGCRERFGLPRRSSPWLTALVAGVVWQNAVGHYRSAGG